jgi:hypothetical protein
LQTKKIIKALNFEIIAFSGGLLYLLLLEPSHEHFSFCLFRLAGIDFCPGCGLGKSISYLLHFNVTESIKTHPLGIPAFLIIVNRIISLLRNNLHRLNQLETNSTTGEIIKHTRKGEKNGKRIAVYAPVRRG